MLEDDQVHSLHERGRVTAPAWRPEGRAVITTLCVAQREPTTPNGFAQLQSDDLQPMPRLPRCPVASNPQRVVAAAHVSAGDEARGFHDEVERRRWVGTDVYESEPTSRRQRWQQDLNSRLHAHVKRGSGQRSGDGHASTHQRSRHVVNGSRETKPYAIRSCCAG